MFNNQLFAHIFTSLREDQVATVFFLQYGACKSDVPHPFQTDWGQVYRYLVWRFSGSMTWFFIARRGM